MKAITTKEEYQAALARIEELLPFTYDDEECTNKYSRELIEISNVVADYEDIHYPISAPSLIDMVKLRMEEMELTPSALARKIGTNLRWLNRFLMGESEPSYATARNISRQLDIDADIVLGVA